MWWFYLISLCGCFDTAHWDFLSVSLLSFINKRAIFSLKVNRDVGNKSEMEDILFKPVLKKIKSNFGAFLR